MTAHIRPIAHMATFPFLASLWERQDEFDKYTLRQDTPGSPHRDTRSIFLMGPEVPRVVTWFQDVPQVHYQIMAQWPEAYKLLEDVSNTLGPRTLGKAMVVELKPGGSLAWHVDEGPYAEAHDRFHVPLLTNPQAWMYSGGEHAHLPVGLLTFFDTSVLHSAVNCGGGPRVHLIVDVRKEGR